MAAQIDPDGSDGAAPLDETGRDQRRELYLSRLGGLWALRGTLDAPVGELLATLLDACATPDPPDTPIEQRRTPAQIRADALEELCRLLAAHGDAPAVHGTKPQLLMVINLAWLAAKAAGADDHQAAQCGPPPRLPRSGEVPLDQLRRFLGDCTVRAATTMGPWRGVNVGRAHRTLPSWLRGLLASIHRHCRGPGCDRPFDWTQAHHQIDWTAGGDTDLNGTIALCHAHHDLATHHGWTVTLDPGSGDVTWTSPEGEAHTVPPATW